ncbi:MAG: antibiotic hydrolase [Acidobacteria bacterium]|nr:MAG: antibiotic hydrolase [Acidobacteriota bacterium]
MAALHLKGLPMLSRTLLRRSLVASLTAVVASLCLYWRAGFIGRAWQADAQYGVVISKNVMVPMRDGVRLATDVCRPAVNGVPAPGKFPTILERTPYGKTAGWATYFVSHGYVAVAQDVRGRFDSEGSWRPHRDDGNDGFDTAKWIGEQPWSDGGIGTVGTSYPGGTQHALALANPPYLKTMIPVDAMSDYGRYGVRHNGAFELRWLNWIFNLGLPEGAHPARDPRVREALVRLGEQVREYAKGLPLRRGMTPLKLAPDYEAWLVEAMSHGDYDDFWKNCGADVTAHVAEYKDIPVYLVGGWYDSWGAQTANLNYVTLSKAKKGPIRLIMGPWTHGGQTLSYAGEAEFGPDATLDFQAFHRRWFDHWLKGIDNGVDREPPVRIFVMGGGDAHRTPEGRIFVGGRWRDEREWPLARTVTTPYYLHADGSLSTSAPGPSAPTHYLFDPKRPVPTLGGNISSNGVLMFAGAADQRCRKDFWMCEDERPLSARNDVLVFETAPLGRSVEVTGRLVVKLWASSSAPDTDFTAKLIDVYPPSSDFPAGVDLNVADSIVRARYRDSLERATLMKPSEIYSFTIEMYPTSLVFKRGHRIRLDVSSSNFPRFDVNPNTGEPLNGNRRWAVADNAVYHDPEHASEILLPIIPASAEGGEER